MRRAFAKVIFFFDIFKLFFIFYCFFLGLAIYLYENRIEMGEKKSANQTEYDKYLRTKEWKERAKIIKSQHPYCSFCGLRQGDIVAGKTVNLAVHHLPEAYDHLGDELNHIDLMTVLCGSCHKWSHRNPSIRNRFKRQ